MSSGERQLIEAMASGDRAAARCLYERYGDGLYRFALASLGDRGAAEDAVQETMVAAWSGARSYRGDSGAAAWLFGICRRQVAMELRRRPRRPEPTEAVEERAATDEPPDARASLREALAGLAPEQRQLLTLVYLEGVPQQEIAGLLGVPLGTVKSRLFSARERLRALMDGGGV